MKELIQECFAARAISTRHQPEVLEHLYALFLTRAKRRYLARAFMLAFISVPGWFSTTVLAQTQAYWSANYSNNGAIIGDFSLGPWYTEPPAAPGLYSGTPVGVGEMNGADVYLIPVFGPTTGAWSLTVNFDSAFFTTDPVMSSLFVGIAPGLNGQLTLDVGPSASTSNPLQSNAEYIGEGVGGSATVNQSGSGNNVGTLYLGYGTSTNGTYLLSGGSLTAISEFEGYNGTGTFQQSGGTHSVSGSLYLGYSSGVSSPSTYSLSAGSLSAAGSAVNTGNEFIGYGARAIFTQTGGSNSLSNSAKYAVGTLYVGGYAGGTGTYNLSGGTLAAGAEAIAQGGTGTINQSGGTNTTGQLTIGSFPGIGTYNLSGTGILSVSGGEEIESSVPGGANFYQTGGSHSAEGLSVGFGGYGSYVLSGGTLSVSIPGTSGSGVLTIGSNENGASGSGTFTLSGGSVSAGSSEILGYQLGTYGGTSTGLFTQTGGANSTQLLYVYGPSATASGNGTVSGTYALQGGNLTASSLELVAGGTFVQTGGTNNAAQLDVELGGASYTLGAGSLAVTTENIEAGGVFTQTGGIHTIGNLSVYSGATFNQTGGSTTISASTTNSGVLSVIGNGIVMTSKGAFTNSGTVAIGPDATLSAGTFTQTSGSTVLNNGTLDPASINVNGGTFGGIGTVVGNMSMNDATLQLGLGSGLAGSAGSLHIEGNYTHSGGSILFEIDPSGSGGFSESTLVLDPGNSTSIRNADVVFDFLNGANPLTFFESGDFKSNTFFKESDGSTLSAITLYQMLSGDTYIAESTAYNITSFAFDAANGATALTESPVPLPPTLWLFLGGLAGMSAVARRGHRKPALDDMRLRH